MASLKFKFKRVWDESCPHVWDSWNDKEGVRWVIRDLLPSDDEEAIKIMTEHWCPDEPLYRHNDIVNNPIAMEVLTHFWRESLGTRMSLGCYREKDGSSKLVALNVCAISYAGENLYEEYKKSPYYGKNKAGENVMAALMLCEEKQDAYEFLGLDKLMQAYGLVVHRDYRGLGLGLKLLAARQPLALHVGVKGTETLFTSPASQILAERAGFTTISTTTWKDFADAGLDYPADETQCVKKMVKKYT